MRSMQLTIGLRLVEQFSTLGSTRAVTRMVGHLRITRSSSGRLCSLTDGLMHTSRMVRSILADSTPVCRQSTLYSHTMRSLMMLGRTVLSLRDGQRLSLPIGSQPRLLSAATGSTFTTVSVGSTDTLTSTL